MKSSRLASAALLVLFGLPVVAARPVAAQDMPQYANPVPAASSTYNENRMSALEDQMRSLNGKLEQIEFSVRRLDQSLQRMQSDNDGRLTQLENAQRTLQARPAQTVPALPVAQPDLTQPPVPLSQNTTGQGQGTAQRVAQTQQAAALAAQQQAAALAAQQQAQQPVVPVNGTLGALKVQDGQVVGGTIQPNAPPLPTVPADYGATPAEQYQRGLDLLRQANYGEAEAAFKAFIDKNPQDKLVDNAKYWYGETLYVRARFDDAAVAFADAYQANPQGTKAPDSLLKLGMSLGALNKTADACTTLLELKSKYPTAPAAVKARAAEERSRLKCPVH